MRGEVVQKPPELPKKAEPPTSESDAAPRTYTEARLQIRLPSGSPLIQTFQAKETLSAVRLFVELNRQDGGQGPVKLMTSFPRKVYEDEDYEKPLDALGLVPSAVLMVQK